MEAFCQEPKQRRERLQRRERESIWLREIVRDRERREMAGGGRSAVAAMAKQGISKSNREDSR